MVVVHSFEAEMVVHLVVSAKVLQKPNVLGLEKASYWQILQRGHRQVDSPSVSARF